MNDYDDAMCITALRKEIETIEHEVSLVYDHVTGGKFSKCNTIAQCVIDAAEESQKSWTDELIAEAVEEKDAEIERLKAELSNEVMGNPPKIPCKNAILLRREQQQECRKIERDHIQEFVAAAYLAIEQRDEAWKKIERLRADKAQLNGTITGMDRGVEKLKQRIEELERDRDGKGWRKTNE